MRIKWLHLSDIHFNYKDFNSHNLREDFIKRIEALNQGEPFTHLFLTGDILFRNQVADCETIEFIRKLISTIGISPENVVIVPGNHDHNREVAREQLAMLEKAAEDTDKNNASEIEKLIDNADVEFNRICLEAFDNFYTVYSSILGSNYYSEYSNPHCIVSSSDLNIVKLNTAWLDTDSGQKGSVLIGSRKLQLLLSATHMLDKDVNIAVGHHPLDEMTLTERERILDLFKRNGIGLYFCGHQHCPDIRIHTSHDVIEFVAPGGYNDGYSVGGYIWGVIDTDCDFYKAEVYNWYNGKWGIDSSIPETDERGIYFFNSSRYSNKTDIVAFDCKTIGGRISHKKIEESLGTNNFDTHTYCGPHDDPNSYDEGTICEFADTIIKLTEDGKTVHLYPLAPIPMLLSLGFRLQKNSRILVHQYDRHADKWVLGEKAYGIKVSSTGDLFTNDILAVSISTSFLINPALISSVFKDKQYDLLDIRTDHVELGYPLYSSDVSYVAKAISDELNKCLHHYNEIHLFAAIPAGLAVELGRNLLSSIYKNVYTYRLKTGKYEQDLIINEDASKRPLSRVQITQLTSTNIIHIPILGKVPCGPIDEAIVQNDKCFPMLESVLDTGDYYILVASGDSMIDAGIEDGDYVLVKHQNTANNGEIVVAYIDEDTTIKRIKYDDKNKKIVLCPENDKYKPIAYNHIDIQGVAVNVIKNL